MPYKNKADADAYAARYRAQFPKLCAARILDWEKRNPEKVKAKDARHRKKFSTKRAAQSKAWREENPGKLAAYNERNKEAKAERNLQWFRDNPIKAKSYTNKRRTKKSQAGGYFTEEEWFTLCFAVGFKCLCCGKRKPLEADHVIPVCKGGTSWLHNIQPLCRSCNAKKHDKCTDFRITLI